MKADFQLVTRALQSGYTISVFDGEEWPVKRSTSFRDIWDAIHSVDEAQLRIRDSAGAVIGWALIVNGLDDDELVADHSANAIMDRLTANLDAQ